MVVGSMLDKLPDAARRAVSQLKGPGRFTEAVIHRAVDLTVNGAFHTAESYRLVDRINRYTK